MKNSNKGGARKWGIGLLAGVSAIAVLASCAPVMADSETKAEIRAQFLTEAVLISLAGGMVGIVVGLALPFSVRFLTNYRLPISGWSVVIAVLVSSFVGILFGTAPAVRAARFHPIESLRYE